MSGADEPIKPGSDVVPEGDDGSHGANKESPPAPPKDDATSAEDSNPVNEPSPPSDNVSSRPANGDPTLSKTTAATEKENKDAGVATPPRCNSPRLRQLLSSPPQERTLSPLIMAELQAAGFLQGAGTTGAIISGTGQSVIVEGSNFPEAIQGSVAAEASVPRAVQHLVPEGGNVPVALQAVEAEGGNVPVAIQAVEAEGGNVPVAIQAVEAEGGNVPVVVEAEGGNVPEAMDTSPAGGNVSEAVSDGAAVEGSVPETENIEMAEESQPPQAPGDLELKTSESASAEDSSNFKKPAVTTRIKNAKGRLEDMKLGEDSKKSEEGPKKSEEGPKSVTESPMRRSARIQDIQRSHSGSPSPKKEKKSARSAPVERTPSTETRTLRTRGPKEGSTSSNSEVESSGDEGKGKRVSRRDSKK